MSTIREALAVSHCRYTDLCADCRKVATIAAMAAAATNAVVKSVFHDDKAGADFTVDFYSDNQDDTRAEFDRLLDDRFGNGIGVGGDIGCVNIGDIEWFGPEWEQDDDE